MASPDQFILGEFRRTLDERYRVSIPTELVDRLSEQGGACILAKERPGSLSLWNASEWQKKLDSGIELVQGKMRAGRLEGRIEEVQRLGRLLSTRHCSVELTGRGRILIPPGFREFLGAEAGADVLIIGAAVCLEIWTESAWVTYLSESIPEFRRLLDELAG